MKLTKRSALQQLRALNLQHSTCRIRPAQLTTNLRRLPRFKDEPRLLLGQLQGQTYFSSMFRQRRRQIGMCGNGYMKSAFLEYDIDDPTNLEI